MSTSGIDTRIGSSMDIMFPISQPEQPLHRCAKVRRQQNLSLHRVARAMGKNVDELRDEEHECTDMPLSRLYEWQRVLGVPLAELLVEPGDELSMPMMTRARLLRIMKTAMAILQRAGSPRVHRLAETLRAQLIELMPELEGVPAWLSVGQRRTGKELGRIAERIYPTNEMAIEE